MTAFSGQASNAKHFLQPTASAMGQSVILVLLSNRCVASFDDPVGAQQDRLGNLETERACGFQVDDQIVAIGLIDR